MPAMALLDRDGVYGAPRFHMAAKKAGIRAHIGAEITCTDGFRYPLLAESRTGYQNLCRLITRMKLRAKKGEGAATPEELAEFAEGLICLTPSRRIARATARHLRPRATSSPRSSATIDREEEARNQAHRSNARAACKSRWWPPTASATRTPSSAKCSTSSPASATRPPSTRPAACSRATPSAT